MNKIPAIIMLTEFSFLNLFVLCLDDHRQETHHQDLGGKAQHVFILCSLFFGLDELSRWTELIRRKEAGFINFGAVLCFGALLR